MASDPNLPILIVDDQKTMLRIIRTLLQQIGFTNVTEALDGTKALELMRTQNFGLILSDWNMEPMSGMDFLKAVRGGSVNENVPFIMVTAENKTENVIAAKQAGVNNYIVKPFNADTLRVKIESVLKA
jgi:two-component system chemotaxis response regulator CheY